MQNICKLVDGCTWNDGSPMFKKLNDSALILFTVVKREAVGEGGGVVAIGPCRHFRGVSSNVRLVPSSLPQIGQGE